MAERVVVLLSPVAAPAEDLAFDDDDRTDWDLSDLRRLKGLLDGKLHEGGVMSASAGHQDDKTPGHIAESIK